MNQCLVCAPNTCKEINNSVLRTWHSHSCNTSDHLIQMDKLLNDLIERGHEDMNLISLFKETEHETIENKQTCNYFINKKLSSEEVLEDTMLK